MLDEKTFKKELVRMLDSLRKDHKGTETCAGVKCEKCPLDGFEYGCSNALSAFEMVEAVEKWSKEHPPKKFKVSRMEYDLLQTVINFGSTIDTFNDFCTLRGLLEKGYFDGATGSMYISDYYNNCEVVD